jgi:ankyrin repeat protein
MTQQISGFLFLVWASLASQFVLAAVQDDDVELVFAIGRQDVPAVKKLMTGRDPDRLINSRGRTPLGEAITYCSHPNGAEVIKTIIDAGANLEISPQPSRNVWNSFVFATSFYHCPLEVWTLLADKGANIAFVAQYGQLGESGFYKGDTLRRAIAERNVDEQYLESLAKFCFDRGLEVDASYFSDLHEGYELTGLQLSVIGGFPKLVKVHTDFGAKLNLRIVNDFSNELQQSAVGFAVQFQENESLKVLLQAGANPNNWTKRDGFTPISRAAGSNNDVAVALLAAHGAYIHPKYQAAGFEDAEITSDALFNARDAKVLATLLKAGANPSFSYPSWEYICGQKYVEFEFMGRPLKERSEMLNILKDSGVDIKRYSIVLL